MSNETQKRKWNRKRWIAEYYGANLSDYDQYQPTQAAREKRLPIYTDGTLEVCVYADDSKEKVKNTLEGRYWKCHKHWHDPSVLIFTETDEKGASANFDY